jgi:integrating conjugative element membrane protein (TIGR03747 family)
MVWVAESLGDGRLRINGPGGALHVVPEGLLLVSPRIFREYAKWVATDQANAGAEAVDEPGLVKTTQRQLLREGWHLQEAGGNNMIASFHEDGFTGALLAPVKWLAVTALTLLALLLTAWVVEGVMVFHVWPEGLQRLEALLRGELERAGQLTGWCEPCGRVPGHAANVLYALLFKATGLHDMATHFSECTALSVPDTIVRNTYIEHVETIQVVMVGTQIFGVRLAMLGMTAPLLFLLYVVAMTDGLAQRAIRRASGGRESASLYHRAKHLQVMVLAIGSAVTLVAPVPLDPVWLWVPTGVIVGGLGRVQWAFYKKHV